MTKEVVSLIANKLGLKENEARIYELLLSYRVLTAGEIVHYTSLPISEVNVILHSLVDKGLVIRIPGVVEKYALVTPFKVFFEAADEVSKVATGVEERLGKYSETVRTDLGKFIESFKSKLESFVSEKAQSVKSKASETITLLETLTTQEKAKLGDVAKDVDSHFEVELEAHRKVREDLLANFKGEVENRIDDALNKVESAVQQSAAKTSNVLASVLGDLSARLGSVEKKVLNELAEVSKEFDSLPEKVTEKMVDVKKDFDSKVRSVLESSKEQTSMIVNTLKNEINEYMKAAGRLMSESIRRDALKLRQHVGELGKELETFIKDSMIDAAKSVSSLYTEISKPLRSLNTEYEREVQRILEQMERLTDSSVRRFSSIIEETKAKVAEQIKSYVELQKEVLEEFKTKADGQVAYSIKDFSAASSSIKERFKEVVMKEEDAASKVFEWTREVVKSLILEHSDTVKSALREIEKKIHDALIVESESEEKDYSRFKDAFASMLEVSKREILEIAKATSRGVLREIRTQTDGVINELRKLREKVFENIKEELRKIRWEAEEARRGVERLLAQRVAYMEEQAELVMQRLDEAIKKKLEEINANFGAIKAGFLEAMDGMLAKFTEIVEETKNNFSLSVNSQLSFFKESLEKLDLALAEELKQQVEAAKAEANEFLLGFSKELEKRILEVEELTRQIIDNIDGTFKKQEKISRSLRNTVSSYFVQELKRYIEAFSNTALVLNERLTSLIDARIKTLERLRSKLEKEISSLIASKEKLIEERNANLRNTVDTYVSEKYKEYTELLGSTIRDVEELLHEHAERLKDHMEGVSKRLTETIKETLGKISKFSDSSVSELAALLSVEQESVASETKKLVEGANKTFEQYVRALRNSIAACLDNLAEEVASQIESLKDKKNYLEASLKDSMVTSIEQFEVTLKELESNLTSGIESELKKVDSLTTQLEARLQSLFDKLKSDGSAYSDYLVEESANILKKSTESVRIILETASKKVAEGIVEDKKVFGLKLDEVKNLVEGLTKEAVEEIESAARRIHDEITILVSRYREETEKIMHETRKRIVGEFRRCIEKREKDIEEVNRNITETLAQLVESYERMLKGFSSDLSVYVSEFYKKVVENVKETTDALCVSIKRLLEELKYTEKIMQLTWSEVTKTPLAIEKTSFIVTREAARIRIKDMIARAKKSLVIVAPNLEEVPVQEILELKPSVRIYLFTDFELPRQTNTLMSLMSKSGVRLWRREEKEFFICLRDDEEMFIAPVSKEEPLIAVVSEERSYIEAYKRSLLPLIRSTSKEVSLEDLKSAA